MSSNNQEEEAKKNQALSLEEEEKQRRAVASPNAGLNSVVQCDSEEDQKDLISAYNGMFGGKPGYKAPVVNADGSIALAFPNKGDAENFCMDQAGKGQRFVLIDAETKTVMAYSNGDGTLFHADGSAFQHRDTLKPSPIAMDTFTLPEPGRKPGM
jgi:hypothetical protein